VVELVDAAPELLVPAGVLGPGDGEVFRGEGGHRRETHRVRPVERVANPQPGHVDQADDVTGVGGLDAVTLTTEQVVGVLGGERPTGVGVGDGHPAVEDPRADP
jgi:hypothetical protein